MRIVFLDIDGVLNAEPRIKNVHDPIVPEFVDQINLIHSKITDVQYVIVSAWAGKGLDYITTKLQNGGFTGIIHVDWHAEYPCHVDLSKITRGDRVTYWLAKHQDIKKYIVLDNSYDYYQEQNHIWINSSGITAIEAFLAISLLADDTDIENKKHVNYAKSMYLYQQRKIVHNMELINNFIKDY